VTVHKRPFVVAIDGPAGSGKGTIATGLAQRLGFSYCETGFFFRVLAWHLLHLKLKPENIPSIENVMASAWFQKEWKAFDRSILREEHIGTLASEIAKISQVRTAFTEFQRQEVLQEISPGVILEGRDTGSSVFPDAECKIFLTAAPEVRAHRRFQELQQKGTDISYDQVLKDLCHRDENDTHRALSPLKWDATYHKLDTSSLSIEESIQATEHIIHQTLAENIASSGNASMAAIS
jgi:cytidylate kinase